MNTEKLITALRTHLKTNTALIECYSPALPQLGEDIACISLLGGNITNNLCNLIEYSDLQLRVLIRAKNNDTEARKLTDDVFNALHLLKDLSFTGGSIINCIANAPIYVGKDENQRILYNITFNIKVK
jgi:hypothetical protein